MNEIICPHCSKAFKIDETGYADIVRQVHDAEFEQALSKRLALAAQEKQNAVELAEARSAVEAQRLAANKDAEIVALKAKLDTVGVEKQLAVSEALSEVQKQRDELKNGLERSQLERNLAENALKEKYETQLKDRDEAIERLKDMKARLSTKMVGETLEQHCEIEFNKIRSLAFPRAHFEKDNDSP